MTQAPPLEERVAKLEREMVEVRFMAGRTDREVSDLQTVLHGHTRVLNAIRQDQVDHGQRLTRVETEMRDGFAMVNQRFVQVAEKFAQVDANFAKVDGKFELLRQGQEKITELLTRQIEDCEK